MSLTVTARPRFSGHESFACRFAWLPKAIRLIARDAQALSNDETSMLELGLGKNMVHSLRFWLDAFGVASPGGKAWGLLPFGKALFGEGGLDPYIERVETQWLLHWQLSTSVSNPLFAWRHILFRRPRSDFTRTELLAELRTESEQMGFELSDATLLQHADIFLHSYLGSLSSVSPEDTLDGPLVDLGLLRRLGRKRGGADRTETVFTLNRVSVADIGPAVIDYVISSFWSARRSGESTVTFRDLAHAEGSPGATLRLHTEELREHLERQTRLWVYRPSGDVGSITTNCPIAPDARLQEIYA